MDEQQRFLTVTEEAFLEGSFHKLALGKPGPEAGGFLAASGRSIDLKEGPRLSLTLKTARKEEVRNIRPDRIAGELGPLLGRTFLQADLFTSRGTFHLLISRKGAAKFLEKNQVVTKLPPRTHDKAKKRYLDLPGSPWSRALGLTDAAGNPVPAMKDKIHQLEKFLELVDHQLTDSRAGEFIHGKTMKILDLGAGKGYLSFALYQWLTMAKGWTVELQAVEVQPELCRLGNLAAAESGFTGLKFLPLRIDQVSPDSRDMVIVLHACDTATDDALALGIRSGARWIFAAPCCHQQLRASMKARGGLDALLHHGILLERQAEILTDGLRALVLEIRGYRTKVQEFVPAEHSGKNLLITAVKTGEQGSSGKAGLKAEEELQKIQELYGLERVYLQSLLELEDLSDLKPAWRSLGVVARESLSTKDLQVKIDT